MENELLNYYNGDEFAAGVWQGKYAVKDRSGNVLESTPEHMHWRMAYEFAKIESQKWVTDKLSTELSPFGKELFEELSKLDGNVGDIEDWIFKYLNRYKYIIPQGSIMTMLGNSYTIGSLSNCFVIPPPRDSYGGIFKTDQEMAQLEKRRGGVGTNLNTLRPEGVPVKNAAGTSTGAHSFMERYSNTTREVAQNGRRGALMLLMSCKHPDIFKFVSKKADLTKVTGANVSSMLTDEFMKAAMADEDFYCTFPVNIKCDPLTIPPLPYNKIVNITSSFLKGTKLIQVLRIHAKELYDLIIEMAWKNGEPGVAFIDRVLNYCPEGVYEDMKPIASNPCGEQWMQAYDACRLLAGNLFSVVINHWKKTAKIDYDKVYEVFYIQQRFADDIVDLEIEAVDKIIEKIEADDEEELIKATELNLWKNIREVASKSRRTGCGFTAMADMLAALGLKYDSDEAIKVIEKVMHTKMRAELDCTIDMAIQRGPFEGWDKDLEFFINKQGLLEGKNSFYQMLVNEFPKQAKRMFKYGRRNVSWSTVAPTGTVSIVALLKKWANTSAGIEPVFSCYHFRNKKVNPSDKNARVDFTDQNGDSWMTYPVVMGGFKEWIEETHDKASFIGIENLPKETIEELFKQSPYYLSTANDINWEKRIEIQSIVQKYTTNAISSTLNLPNDVKKEVVGDIYKYAWEKGLKGVTVYRDGCRTGVMIKEKREDSFEYRDAAKRPKELDAELFTTSVKGNKYAVIIGKVDGKPYEVFAFSDPDKYNAKPCEGKIIKIKKGSYSFKCDSGEIQDIQQMAIKSDELVLTRLISSLLRHGAKPQFVMEQIDKCELEVVSFGKAVSRILKKYCSEEEMVSRNKCNSCGSTNLKMQEGCLVCSDCGNSKC